MAGHVLQLFRGQGHLGEVVDGGFQLLKEGVRVGRVVPVGEAERAFRIGEQLDIGIRSGKLVKVCIQDGMNHIGLFLGMKFGNRR